MIIPNGHEISVKRIHAGLSMRELARVTGLNIATISNVESKSKSVTPKTAKKICQTLEAPFDNLFTIQ